MKHLKLFEDYDSEKAALFDKVTKLAEELWPKPKTQEKKGERLNGIRRAQQNQDAFIAGIFWQIYRDVMSIAEKTDPEKAKREYVWQKEKTSNHGLVDKEEMKESFSKGVEWAIEHRGMASGKKYGF